MKKEKRYKISYWSIFVFGLLLALMVPLSVANAADEGSLTIRKFRVEDYENLKESTGHSSDSVNVPEGAETMEGIVYTLEKLLVSTTDTQLTPSTPVDTSFPAMVRTTDENGEAVFENLPLGYYLVTGTIPSGYTAAHDGKFVVRIPNIITDEQGNETTYYDVVVYPKMQRIPDDDKPVPNEPVPQEPTPEEPRAPGAIPGDGSGGKGFASSVKTGDIVRVTGILLLAIASGGIMLVMIRRKKEKRQEMQEI